MRALNYKTLHIMTFWNPIYFDVWILALLVAGTTTSIRSAPTVRCLNSRTWASGTSATSAWPRKSSYFNPLVFWHTKLFLAQFARSLCVVLPWIVGANKANEYNKVVIKAQSFIFSVKVHVYPLWLMTWEKASSYQATRHQAFHCW